jgi:hypothetical protein
VFAPLDDGRIVSAAYALISALYAPYQDDPFEESVYLDLAQVARKLMVASDVDVAEDAPFLRVALRVLVSAVEQRIVSPSSVELIAALISDMTAEDTGLTELLARLDGAISNY